MLNLVLKNYPNYELDNDKKVYDILLVKELHFPIKKPIDAFSLFQDTSREELFNYYKLQIYNFLQYFRFDSGYEDFLKSLSKKVVQ